jgi:hypothetical protein
VGLDPLARRRRTHPLPPLRFPISPSDRELPPRQPVVRSLCFQGYLLFTGGLYVRLESILTALVFDHALRIRLTAEVSADDGTGGAEEDGADGSKASWPESRATTPTAAAESDDDEAERAHSRAASAASGLTAVNSRSAAAADSSKDNKAKEAADKKAKEKKAKGANLTGKINNLVTSDMCVPVLC